jgi:hypothetical protein
METGELARIRPSLALSIRRLILIDSHDSGFSHCFEALLPESGDNATPRLTFAAMPFRFVV